MNTHHTIIPQILDWIAQEHLDVGAHLSAQRIADRLRVSRSPVNHALQALVDMGIAQRRHNRGVFLAQKPAAIATDAWPANAPNPQENPLDKVYFTIAEDLLVGHLPMAVSETSLRARYSLTTAQLQTLLTRISNEGWVRRKPGYGWEFSSMMTSPDTLLQSYRMRLALEPAALREPGYHLPAAVIARCRAAETHLLNGGIETSTADQLHARGVRFHEALVQACGNPFFIDAITRINQVRRLLSYRSMRHRARYQEHCEQHLEILALLEANRVVQASRALRAHLQSTLKNLSDIRDVLRPTPPAAVPPPRR